MATKYPTDDTIHTSTELVTLDTVRWQIYVLTSNALKLTDSGQAHTLPDISIFCQLFTEENTFFISNLTLKGLDKPIVVHWGDKLFPQDKSITEEREVLRIPVIGNIHFEFDLEEFIMINPRTSQELENIHKMLKIEGIYCMDNDPEIVELLFALSQVSEKGYLFAD
eukprot:TRINITY_DN7505_c0_g1_i1.p1 TRINITY_DN7505_c0_g1~~TRINITY_DN7505_c0_g1_i1.p1  ORF type:complete len:167 (-),score=14.91 TRINITY_DN7505_c0_g1_i1:45-545(-)